MTAQEYQKLWLSEGGGRDLPGYQEIIVEVSPYPYREESISSTTSTTTAAVSSSQTKTVKAIALRAADHIRLKKDRDPSQRYMNILIQELCMGFILLPGSIFGFISTTILALKGTPWKPMFGNLQDGTKKNAKK